MRTPAAHHCRISNSPFPLQTHSWRRAAGGLSWAARLAVVQLVAMVAAVNESSTSSISDWSVKAVQATPTEAQSQTVAKLRSVAKASSRLATEMVLKSFCDSTVNCCRPGIQSRASEFEFTASLVISHNTMLAAVP
jgi:hypothetical protein